MKPAVLVINWNSGPHLRRLLHSLAGLESVAAKILVLDNGSADDSCQKLPQLTNLELELLSENLGFAAAANRGMDRLRSDWIYLLNPDIVVEPVILERLYRHAQDSDDCAIVFGPLCSIESSEWQAQFQCRDLPTPWSLLSDAVFWDELVGWLKRSPCPAELPSHPVDVEQPAAAYWLLRRKSWQEVGGFDEDFYPAWFEDVDFCQRLRDLGWRARFFPDCPVRHVGGASMKTLTRSCFTQIYYRNMLRFVQKHYPSAFPLLWLPVTIGSWIRQRRVS